MTSDELLYWSNRPASRRWWQQAQCYDAWAISLAYGNQYIAERMYEKEWLVWC